MTNQYSWVRLLYSGLQSAGAAFWVSASLGWAIRRQMMRPVQPGWEVSFGAGLWFGLGLLWLAPALWAVSQRLRHRRFSSEQSWSWREASVLSLTSTPAWWFAPALLWS